MLVTLRFSPKFSTIHRFHFELMLIKNPVSHLDGLCMLRRKFVIVMEPSSCTMKILEE